jgi:hypothetical protein
VACYVIRRMYRVRELTEPKAWTLARNRMWQSELALRFSGSWAVCCLAALPFYLNWKLGAAWSVLAVLGFVAIEKMLMRRVDHAAPR